MEDERLPDSAATSGANDKTLMQPVRPAKTMTQLTLKIELDNGICFSINAGNLPWLIGRGQNCDIRVPQSSVSRQHCELYLKNGVLFLKDTSTNGTIVGNKRLRGESVSIDAPTTVSFAGDATITITPSAIGNVIKNRKFISDRRESDRRQTARRMNVCVVQFERRANETRRKAKRRVVPGR
ncbi:MAG: FHA domain-containing protein, partial [Proteobacteria bacterium]|nr:FHA domain-containing protein [Pseudomonadota bacterium]